MVHLFGVHYIFVPRLQADLDTFTGGWDNHSLRSEGGVTPEQFWCMGHLQDLHEGERLEVRTSLELNSSYQARCVTSQYQMLPLSNLFYNAIMSIDEVVRICV